MVGFASQTHVVACPLVKGFGEAAVSKVTLPSAATAQVELLADLTEHILALVVREKPTRRVHPPAHVIDAVRTHPLESLVPLPRFKVGHAPRCEQTRHHLEFFPVQTHGPHPAAVLLDPRVDVGRLPDVVHARRCAQDIDSCAASWPSFAWPCSTATDLPSLLVWLKAGTTLLLPGIILMIIVTDPIAASTIRL